MTILIEKPGILTTVQNLGRHGYRRFGINPGGVMDRTATVLINTLLGNELSSPVMEMHFPAARVAFEHDTIFALGGADLQPEMSGVAIENWRPITARQGDVLTFTGKASGERTYLAVAGGLTVDEWLGSSSTNLTAKIGGHEGRKLEAGDRIACPASSPRSRIGMFKVSPSLVPRYSRFPTVRVIAGGEFDKLDKNGRRTLVSEDFLISNNSNRMGFRLKGVPISLTEPLEMISSAVDFGTIQLLPDGQLIVLMADHQTAGGYPRIAHVISQDLPLLAQLGANDKVAFHLVDMEHAESIADQFEQDLSFFRVGCRFQASKWTV